jgi:hypothetical protein
VAVDDVALDRLDRDAREAGPGKQLACLLLTPDRADPLAVLASEIVMQRVSEIT